MSNNNLAREKSPSELHPPSDYFLTHRNPHKSNASTIEDYVVASDMFVPTGKRLGQGSWGSVNEYTDVAGRQRWAIKLFDPDDYAKEKMKRRNLTEDGVMITETIPLSAAASHVAPRIISRDLNGKMFIAMPAYQGGTLAKKIGQGTQEEFAKNAVVQLATAADYMHRVERKAHGDIKPDNVLLDERGNLFLSDLGSSTCISMGSRSKDPRDRIGAKAYRAPECYLDESHHNSQSDVFSLGAVALELFTGQRVYDGINPETASPEELQKSIRKKLGFVPRKFRKTISKSLCIEPYDRPNNGKEFLESFEKNVKRYEEGNSFAGALKTALKIGIPAAGLALGIYGAATHEPEELSLPSINQRVEGLMYKNDPSSNIDLQAETISGLPASIHVSLDTEKYAKLSTNNRVVAYLVNAHAQAVLAGAGLPYTDNQYKYFLDNTDPGERNYKFQTSGSPVYPVIAKSLEVALNLSKIDGNKVDLEDTMAISRVGLEKVMQAKRVSASQDWRAYREAKGKDGEYIIPKKEIKFINQWLSNYHAG